MVKEQVSLFKQPLFRAIVTGGTGLALGVMLGSLALIQGRDATGFLFVWNAWSLVIFVGAWVFNRSFWRSVFRVDAEPTHANRANFVFHLFALGVLGLGAFLYPIRFLEQRHYFDIARGLFTAFVFLGGVAVLLFKVGRGLFAAPLKDGQSS